MNRAIDTTGMTPTQAQTPSEPLERFVVSRREALQKGPVALIFAEDAVEVDSTLQHHLDKGFDPVVLFAPDLIAVSEPLAGKILRVRMDKFSPERVAEAVNLCAAAAPETWFYYGYNAEYLFYPFCETRNAREMLAFHSEERRRGMLTYVIDLYAGDLKAAPNGVARDNCLLDRTGYYALQRKDAAGHALERQLDFFGGLRWRFEEHVPKNRRRIDRIGLFRAQPKLTLNADHTFSEPEYNTVSCPWHHNLTAAICSFRAAKALRTNPGSAVLIPSYMWQQSVPFTWDSRQLLDLGLIEPGQWF